MEKVIVIGSNSFSGSDFIDLLLEEGTFNVIAVSRSKEKSALFLPYKKRNSPHLSFHQLDLNHDTDKLEQLIDDFKPDYIVNFAAQSEVLPSWSNPHHWFQTNAVALTKLAHILKDKRFLKRYVHISSPEVYGSCEGNIKEDSPLNPSTPYAASKAAGDLSLFTFAKNFPFPLVMVRSTNVYGAHQQLFKIIPRSIIYIKQGRKIELHGGGKAVKSYIHIRDISHGELQIMLHGKHGEIYHLSPDNGIAVRDVVDTICKKLNKPFKEATVDVEERLGQDKAYTIDSSKARKEFGWQPKVTLEQGIEGCVTWISENFKFIEQESLYYIHKE